MGQRGADITLRMGHPPACDGKTFTKKWIRGGIEWGEVKVHGDIVLLTYVKIFVNGMRTFSEDPIRYREVLHVTPKGLE